MKHIRIGSAPGNTIVLAHPSVSANHLEIIQDDQGVFLLTDLNSWTGTFVNGYRIQATVQLRPTDTVKAGEIPLPWQSYFAYQTPVAPMNPVPPVVPPVGGMVQPPQFTQPMATPPPEPPSPEEKKRKKKKMMMIIGSAVLVVVLGIIGLIYMYTRPSYAHLKFIPSNAFMVTSVNFKSLAGKVDMEKIKSLDFYTDMKDEARDRNEVLAKAIGDPLTSGIDLFSQPYAFMSADNNDYMRFSGGIVFAIKNSDDFYQFVSRLSGDERIKSDGNFNYLKLDGSSCVAWNSDGGILYFSDRSNSKKENYCRSLFEQEKEQSILSVESFNKFKDANYDIGFFVNYDGIRSIPGATVPSYMRGSSSMATLNFENGKLAYASEYFPSTSDANPNAPAASFLKPAGINADLKAAIPGNALGIVSVSMDMKALFEYMDKDSKLSPALDEIARNLDVERKDLAGLLSGDAFATFIDMKEVTYEWEDMNYDYEYDRFNYVTTVDTAMVPSYLVGATIKDDKAMEAVITRMELKDTIAGIRFWSRYRQGNTYLVHHAPNYFICNDFDLAKQLSQTGKASTPLSGLALDLVTSAPVAGYFNMNLSKYPPSIPTYLKDEMGRRDYATFSTFSGIFDYTTLKADGQKQTMDIYFTDTKTNALNTLFTAGNDLYVQNIRH